MKERILKSSDYGARENQAVLQVLVELAQVLGGQQGSFVIVGGSVPSLLFDNAKPKHIGTLDVDLNLNPEVLLGYSYAELVKDLEVRGYKRNQDDLKPFQLLRKVEMQDKGSPVSVIIDLLMPKN